MVPCAAVANGQPILPYRGTRVVITENRDKTCRIVNGQDAVLVSARNTSLLIQFPDNERAFVYPVTHHVEGEGDVTRYPFTPAYAQDHCTAQWCHLAWPTSPSPESRGRLTSPCSSLWKPVS